MVNQNKPFFSVIIPTLNEEKYLPLLLRDLSKQTTKSFEVIIVDGNSDDKTVARASKFKDLLPSLKIISTKVRNVSFQRNLGAKNASGTFLLFNDADNLLPRYFLEGVKYQLKVKKRDLFTCWCKPDSNNSADRAISTYLNLLVESAYLLNNQIALGAMIGCRRSIFKDVGGFDRTIGFAEDTEFVQRGAQKGYRFGVIHEPRYTYSLRRFRKIGKIKLIQKYAILNIKFLTNQKVDQKKEYPMGGGYLEESSKTTPDFLQTIQNIFGGKTKNTKLTDRIKALLSLEENGKEY